jgi:phage FluMu gp28-like protein
MSKNQYEQLIANLKETRKKYHVKEITQEEALEIFDTLLDTYLELKHQDDTAFNLELHLTLQN